MTSRWMIATVAAACGLAAWATAGARENGPALVEELVVAGADGAQVAEPRDLLGSAADVAERGLHAGGSFGAFLGRGVLFHPGRLHAAAARLVPEQVSSDLALFMKVTTRAVHDAAMQAEVKTVLTIDPSTAGESIDVYASNGRVFLRGAVERPQAAAHAVRDALGIDGVRTVDARLAVGGTR